MDLISNDWKHLRRTETSQKSFLKTFYYNNKSSKKVKDFQKLSNKTIYLTRQSISTKYKYKIQNTTFQIHFIAKISWRTPYSQSWNLE